MTVLPLARLCKQCHCPRALDALAVRDVLVTVFPGIFSDVQAARDALLTAFSRAVPDAGVRWSQESTIPGLPLTLASKFPPEIRPYPPSKPSPTRDQERRDCPGPH